MLDPRVTLEELLSEAVPDNSEVTPNAEAPTFAVTDLTEDCALEIAWLTALERDEVDVVVRVVLCPSAVSVYATIFRYSRGILTPL